MRWYQIRLRFGFERGYSVYLDLYFVRCLQGQLGMLSPNLGRAVEVTLRWVGGIRMREVNKPIGRIRRNVTVNEDWSSSQLDVVVRILRELLPNYFRLLIFLQ